MTENELSQIVVDIAFQIHTCLGPGLLESVYQKVFAYELRKRGVTVEEEVPLPVIWDEVKMDVGFRLDLFVERKLIIELKSVEKVSPVHKKVLLTYLRLSNCKLGLLMNFGEELMKTGITRVVNGL
jgi:GxxExxY protein